MSLSNSGLSILVFLAGVTVPLMAVLNTALAQRLDSSLVAVFILSCFAATTSAILMFLSGSDMKVFLNLDLNLEALINGFLGSAVFYMAGLLFVFYILSMTIATPKLGIANAVFLVLIGQLISATILDHYGFFVEITTKLSPSRLLGLGFMAIGIILARS